MASVWWSSDEEDEEDSTDDTDLQSTWCEIWTVDKDKMKRMYEWWRSLRYTSYYLWSDQMIARFSSVTGAIDIKVEGKFPHHLTAKISKRRWSSVHNEVWKRNDTTKNKTLKYNLLAKKEAHLDDVGAIRYNMKQSTFPLVLNNMNGMQVRQA